MTAEQYRKLVQYAAELRSAIYAYEHDNGVIYFEFDNFSEIVMAGANLMQFVESLEPINSPLEADHF